MKAGRAAGFHGWLSRLVTPRVDEDRRFNLTLNGLAAVAILLATLLLWPLRDHVQVVTVALIYLVVVLGVAIVAGGRPAILASILSFVLLNLVFIPPYGTRDVARGEFVVALVVYVAVAAATGQLVARLRTRTAKAVREQRRTSLLFELNAALIAGVTPDAMLERITERVVTLYGARSSRVLLPGHDDELAERATYPRGLPASPDRGRLAMASWTLEHGLPAGRSTSGRRIMRPHAPGMSPGFPRAREEDVLYVPISTGRATIGVLEVAGKPGGGRFNRDDEQLLTSFANQAALALERARLAEEAARAEVLARSDELKSALLAAVSHDFRTPLAAIKASATALLDESVAWDDEARREFLTAIDEETDRLALMVANLLDLTRIEGGVLRPDREWYDVNELFADVEARLEARAASHPLTLETEPDLPLLWFDYVEIAQVLVNLCENAFKYTPSGTPIRVRAVARPDAVEFSVADRGAGIPPAKLGRLFEKFYRVDPSGPVAGTGIGLTISKGLVEAHGGKIWVTSSPGEGTIFSFTIPRVRERPNGG